MSLSAGGAQFRLKAHYIARATSGTMSAKWSAQYACRPYGARAVEQGVQVRAAISPHLHAFHHGSVCTGSAAFYVRRGESKRRHIDER